MSEEEDYNSSSSSEDIEKVCSFDKFISIHLDNVLDIFYEFKVKFAYNPYFLDNLKSQDLLLFLYEHLYENYNLKIPKQLECLL